MIFIQ